MDKNQCNHDYKRVAKKITTFLRKFLGITTFKKEYVKAYHLICHKCGDYKYIKLQDSEVQDSDKKIIEEQV